MRDVLKLSASLLAATVLATGFAGPTWASSSERIPDNLGGGLRQLVEAQRGIAPAVRSGVAAFPGADFVMARSLVDTQGRVLVNVWLDGKRPLATVRQSLEALGAQAHAELPGFRKGVVAVYLPVGRAVEAAGIAGVRSIILEHKPEVRIGKATTQGLKTINADKLNALGYKGQGMTIGAMSDSFDTVKATPASADIKSGDLPGPGNPNGDTTPVLVLDEDPVPGTDEGRALLQIIYDIAPRAKLCYATAFTGEVQFAVNILKLADKNGPCKADVIDDDVSYSNEPFFSDGAVALAVDQVVADGVSYFSSAGNDNSGNYSATFNPLSDAMARNQYSDGLVLGNVDTGLTGGGFHNFGTAAKPAIALPIDVPAQSGTHFMVLQWDDPFFGNIPTASYSLLVFDQNGFYHPELSGIDNIYSTGQPVQGILLPNDGDTDLTFYVAIALRPGGAPNPAPHLKVIDFDDGNQVTLLKFRQNTAPALYGHPAAAGAVAVAADFWDNTTNTEYYSSLGPVQIWLDADNMPLKTATVRLKPDVAAPDGVDTTFFGGPAIPGDPNPVFFGTSAAAPHAAAVGALLIEAAGGPGKLTPARLKTLLTTTTQQPHSLRAGTVTSTVTSGADSLTLTVTGFLPLDPNQFQFAFTGAAGDSVREVVINAKAQNLSFGDNTDQFLIGPSTIPAADIDYINKNGLSPAASIVFKPKTFTSGNRVHLGLDLDDTLLGAFGINSGLLYGATVTVKFMDSAGNLTTATGTLGGPNGRGFSPADGFGLIDAYAAYQALKPAAVAKD